jgi:hypothetical protein
MNKIESIEYKGYNINIYSDDSTDSPAEWDNTNFLVHYHRDCWIEDKRITESELAGWYNGEKLELEKTFFIFPVSALIHSGVWLSLHNSFAADSGGWDTSHVGAMFISKTEAKTKDGAYKLAGSLLKTWNQYLSGEVYGYMIEDKEGNGDEIGGVWGFYGDWNESGLIESAKDEIDEAIENEAKNGKQLFLKYWIDEMEAVLKKAKRLTPAKTAEVKRNLISIQKVIEKG